MKKLMILLVGCVVVASITTRSSYGQSSEETTVAVSATVLQQPISITVSGGPAVFGDLDPVAAGQNRFLNDQTAATLKLSWNATIGTDWTIEVSTSNTGNFPGLVDPSETRHLPLKYWHPGLGGVGDPNDETEWENNFFWVFDPTDDGVGPGSDGFVTEFASSARGDGDIAEADFRFAIEVADDAFPTSYGAVVKFELIIGP